MREIKFRGQTYDTPPHWVFGDLYHYTTGESAINYPHPHKKWLESEPVRSDTVGQFTGLRDADGREIYEGDIVSWGDGTPPTSVRWDEHFAYYVIMESLILSHACKAVRVIGNIHDNPELLK